MENDIKTTIYSPLFLKKTKGALFFAIKIKVIKKEDSIEFNKNRKNFN